MEIHVRRVLEEKQPGVETVTAETIVCDAVAVMNARNIGSVVVLGDQARPIGIFTERDVLTRVVACGRDPMTTRVAAVMSSELIVLPPSATVHEAMSLMTLRRCRHLPVVVDGALIGMISIGDLTRWVVLDQQRTIDELNDYIHR